MKPAMGWVIAYGVIFGALVISSLVLEVWKKLRRDGKTDAAHEVVEESLTKSRDKVDKISR